MKIQHTQQAQQNQASLGPVGSDQIAAVMKQARLERSAAFWAFVAQISNAARGIKMSGRRAGRPHLGADAVPY